MIIRGIPEKKKEEKWDETRATVCEALSKAFKLEETESDSVIERIHRGKQLLMMQKMVDVLYMPVSTTGMILKESNNVNVRQVAKWVKPILLLKSGIQAKH